MQKPVFDESHRACLAPLVNLFCRWPKHEDPYDPHPLSEPEELFGISAEALSVAYVCSGLGLGGLGISDTRSVQT